MSKPKQALKQASADERRARTSRAEVCSAQRTRGPTASSALSPLTAAALLLPLHSCPVQELYIQTALPQEMTATLTAVPPSSAPASNGTAPAAGGAVAQRVPLEQFDSVFGSLIGTSPNSHSRLVERVLTSRRYHSLGLTSRRIFRYRQPHPALCVSAIHHTVHATSRYAAPELKELSSDALGGHVVDVSDEFFCSASNLLKVPVRLPLQRFLNAQS